MKKNTATKKLVAMLLAVVLLLGLAGCSLTNKLASPEQYFENVEKKDVADLCDTQTVYYENYVRNLFANDNKYNVKMQLTLNDGVKDSIRQSLGGQLDVDWLGQTDFDMTVNVKGGKSSTDLLFGIGGQHVLTLASSFDSETNSLLLALREITDDVLKFNAENSGLSALSGNKKQEAANALPDAATVTKLLTNYHGMILEGIENIEKSSEDMTLDDVTQTVTVLTCTVPQAKAKEIELAILNDMKTDSDVRSIIENLQALLDESEPDGSVAYDRFLEKIDARIAEIEAIEYGEDAVVMLYDYVNSKDEIVGRRIEQGDKVTSYLTLDDGKAFVTKADLSDGISVSESGTKKGDLVTSDRYISENGTTVSKISFTDFDSKAAKKGQLSGKIRIYPNSEGIDAAASGTLGDLAELLNIACELDIKGDWTAGEFNLTVFNGDAELFSMKNASYAISAAGEVTEPAGKQITVDGLDSLEELTADLHLDPLVENLRGTPVPTEYVDAIAELSDQLKAQ